MYGKKVPLCVILVIVNAIQACSSVQLKNCIELSDERTKANARQALLNPFNDINNNSLDEAEQYSFFRYEICGHFVRITGTPKVSETVTNTGYLESYVIDTSNGQLIDWDKK